VGIIAAACHRPKAGKGRKLLNVVRKNVKIASVPEAREISADFKPIRGSP
jgi:hypothetical protein